MTLCRYLVPVSDRIDRRALQKSRTRSRIRQTAQGLFTARGFEPVTVVEIAAAAGCSVQTVFNHFSSKEELFFADRATWVEETAAAVRDRAPRTRPEDALRRRLVGAIGTYARGAGEPHHRRMAEVLEASPALLSYERRLHEEAVQLLAVALAEAWGGPPAAPTGDGDATRDADRDAERACRSVLAEVTASVWLAAFRTVALDIRRNPPAAGDERAVEALVDLIDGVLGGLAGGLAGGLVRGLAGGPALPAGSRAARVA